MIIFSKDRRITFINSTPILKYPILKYPKYLKDLKVTGTDTGIAISNLYEYEYL
jgi:hypothetical protein